MSTDPTQPPVPTEADIEAARERLRVLGYSTARTATGVRVDVRPGDLWSLDDVRAACAGVPFEVRGVPSAAGAQPAPEGRSFRGWWAAHRGQILPLIISLASALVGSALTYFGAPPKVVDRVQEVLVQVPFLDEFAPTQGWVPDQEQIARNVDPQTTEQFAETPAGRAALGDEDVYWWRAVRKAAKLPADRYPNVNQRHVGCCVGAAYKHGADVVQATAILAGGRFEWKPAAVEPIYAGSRVEVGGGRISGDGSVGAWAAKWCREYGLVPMERHGSIDLTTFDPNRARAWGQRGRGVPDELEPLARMHPIKSTALVRTAADVKRALQQGYPVVVCSSVGFRMERDRDGFAAPQGTWAHAMVLIGWRKDRPGAFCLNSWGDAVHTGPVWPADAPAAGFWVDERIVGRMVGEGDSFALADVAGFPARQVPLDWFVQGPRAPRVREFDPRGLFALAW